ncbi:MAG: hypothetical protein IKM48_03130 [Clostridia bacterium]|nr:hypothetical protein [Clostridia bacterium]
MSDGKVIIDTQINNSGLKTGLKSTNNILSGLKGSLAKLGKAAIAAFAIGKVLNFGKQCIELGSNVAEVQNVVDTAFGDMKYKIEDFAKTAVHNFGMSQLSAKKTSSTYMAMAKGMGMEEQAASNMAISLTGLTGDVASFYNISQELADTKLKSVFTGETETLKDLGVVMTQTNLNAYAMANGFGKTVDKMTQAEAVQLRYAFVTEQLRLASGDFIRTQDSWANQTRILSEQWKELMSIIGQGLITVLAPLVKILNTIVSYLIKVATTATAAMEALFGKQPKNSGAGKVAADTAAAVESQEALTNATNETAKAAKNAALGMDELNVISQEESGSTSSGSAGGVSGSTPDTDIISDETASKAEVVSNRIKTAFNDLTNRFKTTFGPSINAWGAAFSNLKQPVQNAMNSMKNGCSTLWSGTLKPLGSYIGGTFVPDVVNSFSENLAPVFSDVFGVAVEEAGKDFEFAAEKMNDVTNDILLPMYDTQKTVATDAMESVGNTWGKYGDSLVEKFRGFRESLREIWDGIYNSIVKPIVDNVINKITELWNEHLKPLWDNVVEFFAATGEAIMTVWNNYLAPIRKWLISVLGPVITKIVNTIWNEVSSIIGVVVDVVSGIFKALKGLMTFITGVFSGDWEKAWEGIKDFFGGIWDGIWSIVKYIINHIIDGLNSLWSAVYKVFKGIVDGIGKAVGWIGDLFGKDWGFSMPQYPPTIPRLAQGAVIPPNREFLAILGDQKSGTNIETPLDTMIQAFKTALSDGGYVGGDTVINLTATLDGDVIYRNQERVRQQRGTQTILTGSFAR